MSVVTATSQPDSELLEIGITDYSSLCVHPRPGTQSIAITIAGIYWALGMDGPL